MTTTLRDLAVEAIAQSLRSIKPHSLPGSVAVLSALADATAKLDQRGLLGLAVDQDEPEPDAQPSAHYSCSKCGAQFGWVG
jgi:hypothetical protein